MSVLLSCFSSFSVKSIWEMSPLVLGETLGAFLNTLTASEKYSVEDCENIQLPIQMRPSQKRKNIL